MSRTWEFCMECREEMPEDSFAQICPDCYKKLQAENEELKQKTCKCVENSKRINDLKAENERLKSRMNYIKTQAKLVLTWGNPIARRSAETIIDFVDKALEDTE